MSPNNGDAYDLYGRLCGALERYEEAITLQQYTHGLDPLMHRWDLATAFMRAQRYDKALEIAAASIEFEREDARGQATYGWALGNGKRKEGLAALERATELAPDAPVWLAQFAQACALHGHPERAREILQQLTEQSRTRYVSPYHLAYVHTGLGQYDQAVDCLEESFEKRAGALYGVKGSFLFRPLHTHPRFQALLRRMNLA